MTPKAFLNEDVEAPVLFDSACDHLFGDLFLRHVAEHGGGPSSPILDPFGAGSRPVLVDVDDEDRRAVGGQLAGDAGADSGGAARHDGDLAVQFRPIHAVASWRRSGAL